MLHANTFMPGRVPPATRLDAHLRAELPAALRAEPLERFLVVLRAHIALLDAPAHSLRKPFNPVLGETSRLVRAARDACCCRAYRARAARLTRVVALDLCLLANTQLHFVEPNAPPIAAVCEQARQRGDACAANHR